MPAKLIIFIWRACSGSLPTLSVLASRFVPVDLECPRCRFDYESVLHALCLCPFAKDCLSRAGLWRAEADAGSFKAWWQWYKMSLSMDDMCRLAAVLWSIWWSRNKKVWSGFEETSHYVVQRGLNGLNEWRAAKAGLASVGSAGVSSPALGWVRPVQGFVKCNFDAAVFASSGYIGFGCVLRDEFGTFVRASNGLLGSTGDALLAEALSFREALSWIRRGGMCNVCFESDSLLLVNAFHSQSVNRSYFGSIVEDCRVLAGDFSNFAFAFVPRSANQVAHSLARASGSSSGSGSWESVPPPFILDVLSFDLI